MTTPRTPLPLSAPPRPDEVVTQTILAGREDGVPGNCIQAAVASLLSLPIDAVPHFLLWRIWSRALSDWLAERDLAIRVRYVTEIPTERCIVAGRSPRGVAHVCVAEGGAIVWDPHPSRDGLVSVAEAWFIEGGVPMTERPDEEPVDGWFDGEIVSPLPELWSSESGWPGYEEKR